eukprot:comp21976_c0_seq1/m.31745 comp21976_c0_seq1/g.31745  ORF comp21976_c0_seq1/g.31745 comp21976_c0_seq1/m.31745 type:complete len:979 (-) comp21976_c0_seq1:429-3365(-)
MDSLTTAPAGGGQPEAAPTPNTPTNEAAPATTTPTVEAQPSTTANTQADTTAEKSTDATSAHPEAHTDTGAAMDLDDLPSLPATDADLALASVADAQAAAVASIDAPKTKDTDKPTNMDTEKPTSKDTDTPTPMDTDKPTTKDTDNPTTKETDPATTKDTETPTTKDTDKPAHMDTDTPTETTKESAAKDTPSTEPSKHSSEGTHSSTATSRPPGSAYYYTWFFKDTPAHTQAPEPSATSTATVKKPTALPPRVIPRFGRSQSPAPPSHSSHTPLPSASTAKASSPLLPSRAPITAINPSLKRKADDIPQQDSSNSQEASRKRPHAEQSGSATDVVVISPTPEEEEEDPVESARKAQLKGFLARHLRQRLVCGAGTHVAGTMGDPRALPCNHTVCVACLQQGGTEVLTCPPCHVALPAGTKIEQLTPASDISALLEDPVIQSILSEDTPTYEPPPIVTTYSGRKVCGNHIRSVNYVCEDCTRPACLQCVSRRHRQHEYTHQLEILDLTPLLSKMEVRVGVTSAEKERQINAAIDILQEALLKRKGELLCEISNAAMQTANYLDDLMDELRVGRKDATELTVNLLNTARNYKDKEHSEEVKVKMDTADPLKKLIQDCGRLPFSAPTDVLVLGHESGSVSVYNARTGASIHTFSWALPAGASGQSMGVECLAVLDGPRGIVVAGSNDCMLRVLDIFGRGVLQTLPGHHRGVHSLCAIDPARGLLASGSADKTIRVWDTTLGTRLHVLKGHTGVLSDMCTLDGPRGLLVSGAEDGTVRLWNAPVGLQLKAMQGHMGQVTAVRVVDVSRGLVASASMDATVAVWNVNTGTCPFIYNGHDKEVWGLCVIDRHEVLLASGSNDCTVRVWAMGRGTIHTMQGHTQGIWSVELVHARRRLVASGSRDCTVRVWDTRPGTCLHVLKGHTQGVWVLRVVSETEGLVASAGLDGKVDVWDIQAGKQLAAIDTKQPVLSMVATCIGGNAL